MGNYDDHPGKGFKEVRGYEPPAGTQAAAEKARRLEEERKRQQKNHNKPARLRQLRGLRPKRQTRRFRWWRWVPRQAGWNLCGSCCRRYLNSLEWLLW